MDGPGQQTIEPVPSSTFEDEVYGVSAQLDPLNIYHVLCPLPPGTSYGSAGLQSCNPYSISVHSTTFDPSYTSNVSSASTHAADSSAAEAQTTLEWSVDLRNYQHQTEGGLEYEPIFHATIGPICTDIDPGYMVQQPDSNGIRPYDRQQVLHGQHYDSRDAVPSFPPALLSNYLQSASRQRQLPGMTKEQLAQQDEALHQQSAAHLRKMSQLESVTGSLGLSRSHTTTVSPAAHSTPASSISSTASTPKPRHSQQATRVSPTTTTPTTTSKPAPVPARRASARQVEPGPTTQARRHSSATSHPHNRDPEPPPKPRRVSASIADQRVRNRAAANKCRLKSKAAISRLEGEERAASTRNAELAAAAAQLREEAYVLRSQLLLHTDCDCTMIQQYLGNRAREVAEVARRRGAVGCEGVGDVVEMDTGRRGGQRKSREWNDHDEGAEVLGSDDGGDYDCGGEE